MKRLLTTLLALMTAGMVWGEEPVAEVHVAAGEALTVKSDLGIRSLNSSIYSNVDVSPLAAQYCSIVGKNPGDSIITLTFDDLSKQSAHVIVDDQVAGTATSTVGHLTFMPTPKTVQVAPGEALALHLSMVLKTAIADPDLVEIQTLSTQVQSLIGRKAGSTTVTFVTAEPGQPPVVAAYRVKVGGNYSSTVAQKVPEGVPEVQRASQTIHVAPGQSTSLAISEAERMKTADPLIADVNVVSDEVMKIDGHKPGTTTLTVIEKGGQAVTMYNIVVP